jgi:sialate O-acetylesterase
MKIQLFTNVKLHVTTFIILAFSLIGNKLYAEIRLPSIIGSHMVLQQKSEVSLWGWCEPGEQIRIMQNWDTVIYKTTGTNGARWSIKIKTPSAGGPYKIVINGSNTIVLEDVMIGEVWVCGGQSNMELSGDHQLAQSLEESPKATNSKIRFFYVPKATAEDPQDNCGGSWKVCSPEDMKHFSAVGYFFGKKLEQQLHQPIGLINANWGGTAAEVWTPVDVIVKSPALNEAAKKLKEATLWPKLSGGSYNAMIYPITNFSIAGTIWYQGESNVGTNSTYFELFTKMMDSWRRAWKKNFPFYYVQIAPYPYGGNNIDCALLREAQTQCMTFPNTGMVVISDLVEDVKNIHPINKIDVANRLANWALAESYDKKDIVYKSPMYKRMEVDKEKIRIYFENAENGLISKAGEPNEFYISGDNQKFLPAIAKIEGNNVIVWNTSVKNPVAVRFGFSNVAMPNLFSKEGLPVNLFRTDKWTVPVAAIR